MSDKKTKPIKNFKESELKKKEPPKKVKAEGIKNPVKRGGGGKGPEGAGKTDPVPAELIKKAEASFGKGPWAEMKIVTGPLADKMCDAAGAAAITKSNMIYLKAGAADLKTAAGQEFLLHEMAHGKQQTGKGENPLGKGASEQKAKEGGKSAQQGKQADVGTTSEKEQHADKKEAEKPETERPSKWSIPLPGGQAISFEPGVGSKTFKVTGLGPYELWKDTEPEKKKVEKRWSIPTPFFGIVGQLGLGADVEFKYPTVGFEGVSVEGDMETGDVTVAASVKAAMGITGRLYFKMGVAADLWVVEAGVGLKAFIALGLEVPITVDAKINYNVKSGKLDFELPWKFAPEIALKAGVSLYAYYDAWGISTYEKEWNLYERTLGKMTLPGIKGTFSTKEGAKIDPVEPSVQDLSGNVSNLFPGKSK